MAASSSSTTITFPTFHPNLTPTHHTSISKLSFLSLQRSNRPTQFPLISCSPSIAFSNNLFRLPFAFTLCSASSQDETVVTEDENDVVVDTSQLPQEDEEGTAADNDGDDSVESDGAGLEESAVSILSSLESYKEALADNNESKISEIESYLKSVEDEKLVLERKLATLSDELSNAKDRVLRISADFDNFRKRTERERMSLVANAQGEVVENLLPVLDNFERAKASIKVETEKEGKINDSYQSIYKQFVEILGSLGVVPVETTGQPFDPLLHEAIMREESTEFEEGVVIQEFRKGFRIGERLLRPSMVKVSAGPGPEKTEPVSPSEPEAQVPGADSVEEPEDAGQSEPSPAQDE
ncbi:hypothetical protein M8C21_025970 [Ambrosia artemisiifolia]|uniref:GrpE protein homolog n=1 Tax=Ambrosia artemisiifolia TaxID=4212 RepID=A0AAD5D8Q7_AMBAR|nr:hypothetical protein M8C21_025970 [Ambrosia artemisiifolia]